MAVLSLKTLKMENVLPILSAISLPAFAVFVRSDFFSAIIDPNDLNPMPVFCVLAVMFGLLFGAIHIATVMRKKEMNLLQKICFSMTTLMGFGAVSLGFVAAVFVLGAKLLSAGEWLSDMGLLLYVGLAAVGSLFLSFAFVIYRGEKSAEVILQLLFVLVTVVGAIVGFVAAIAAIFAVIFGMVWIGHAAYQWLDGQGILVVAGTVVLAFSCTLMKLCHRKVDRLNAKS